MHEKPFLPGERYSISKEMERNVKGYKVIINGGDDGFMMIMTMARMMTVIKMTGVFSDKIPSMVNILGCIWMFFFAAIASYMRGSW